MFGVKGLVIVAATGVLALGGCSSGTDASSSASPERKAASAETSVTYAIKDWKVADSTITSTAGADQPLLVAFSESCDATGVCTYTQSGQVDVIRSGYTANLYPPTLSELTLSIGSDSSVTGLGGGCVPSNRDAQYRLQNSPQVWIRS